MIQWIAFHTSTEGGTRSIPGQGTKILQAVQCNKAKQIKKKQKNPDHLASDVAKKKREMVFFPYTNLYKYKNDVWLNLLI